MKNILTLILKSVAVLGLLVFSSLFYSQSSALAQSTYTCGDVKTSVVDCTNLGNANDGSQIIGLVLLAINILSAGIGIVAVGALAYAGLLYASASDNAAQVQKAIGIIKNVVIGIVSYFALFAFVQYLIPGGVFN